jgi:hypothetical protein
VSSSQIFFCFLVTKKNVSDNLTWPKYVITLNKRAKTREFVINFLYNDLELTSIDSVALQASTLAEITRVPGELTRKAAVNFSCFLINIFFLSILNQIASARKCVKLVEILQYFSEDLTFEQVQLTAKSIFISSSNTLMASHLFYMYLL